jgi:hypothetical protein
MVSLLKVIQLEDTEVIATKYVKWLQTLYMSFSIGDVSLSTKEIPLN